MTIKRSDNNGFGVLALILAILVVAAVTAVAWYILQRDDNSPATNASQNKSANTQNTPQPPAEKTGTFVGLAPKTGSGSVTLMQSFDGVSTVRLEDDFVVQSGPDLFVGFGNNGEVDHDTLFAELEAIKGKQEYQVPNTIDVSQYSQVFIYCKEFSVPFSVATLE